MANTDFRQNHPVQQLNRPPTPLRDLVQTDRHTNGAADDLFLGQ
jgi:hypothetical protein